MSMSPISSRYSTAVMLMQQLSPSQPTKIASTGTSDIVKIANGLSTTPGSAAKQASGLAFDFTVSQAVKDNGARKTDTSGSIIVAGIGGGEAVEQFDSWEALDTRIRTDGQMNDKQKNEWLAKASDMKTGFQGILDFKKSDLYAAITSGAYKSIMNDSIQAQLADDTSLSAMQAFVRGASVRK